MVFLIIRKEIRDLLGSLKFAVTFGVCAVLILIAFVTGAQNYHIAQAQTAAAERENIRQMEGITDWRMVRQNRIMLPPQPLAALVAGVSNDIGRTIPVRGKGDLTPAGSRYGDEPIFATFRFLDLEFVFLVVLSLFAILLAYDSISGEKERGTLRLSFSSSVKRREYILGKLAGSALALGVPLLIPMLIGAALLPALGIHLTQGEWARLGLIVVCGLLYFGVFLTLSIFVSASSHRSSTSFLLLLSIWIFSMFVIPRTAVLLAGRMVDVPSAESVASQKAMLSAQLWSEDQQKLNHYTPPAGLQGPPLFEAFNAYMQNLGNDRDKKLQELTDRLNEDRRNRLERQTRLALGISRISPAAAFSLASSEIAATSLAMKDEFFREAVAYQGSYGAFMTEKTGMNPGGGMMIMRMDSDSSGGKPKPINPYELPAFTYRGPSEAGMFPNAAGDMGLLVLFIIVFFALAFNAFQRYDVR